MAGIEICRLVWGSLELLKKHHKTSRRHRNCIRRSTGTKTTRYPHPSQRKTHAGEQGPIYAVQGYSSSRVLAGPPSPHRVPLSQSASWSIRQGIVTIPGLGRPSRRPLPSGAVTSPQGRPEMQSGVEQCLVHAMPKQQTFCVLKHFIATTKTATPPESPTVTNP